MKNQQRELKRIEKERRNLKQVVSWKANGQNISRRANAISLLNKKTENSPRIIAIESFPWTQRSCLGGVVGMKV